MPQAGSVQERPAFQPTFRSKREHSVLHDHWARPRPAVVAECVGIIGWIKTLPNLAAGFSLQTTQSHRLTGAIEYHSPSASNGRCAVALP